MRICPQPAIWNEVYQRLKRYADCHACGPQQPPTPLLLAGWIYSNDVAKLRCWEAMMAWATQNGCSDFLSEIPAEQFYCVETPTSYVVGPMGGPMFRQWDSQSRTKPDDATLVRLMEILESRWTEVVGQDLAKATSPIGFTGAKARRLVVLADGSALPPWGTWTERAFDEEKRRSFTRLRAAINSAIAPHEVDHIDFKPEKPPDPVL